jgi:predicted AlkP superfamily pyrophosphatase or phosphodiesterase
MLSLDAVSSDDISLISKFPNFSKLLAMGTIVNNVSSVFVSNTYPCHTSIITGMLPKCHGINDNLYLSPERKIQKWRCDSRKIKEQTLYEKAHQAGLKTCSILYPVTGKAKIDWNFPEIAEKMCTLKKLFYMLRFGSKGFIISTLFRFGKQFKGTSQPALDDFSTAVAADAIIRHKPDLMMLHLIDTDEQKHLHGPGSEQAASSLERHDKRIGILLDAMEKSGTLSETGIIIFSDHGCLPVHTTVNPNAFLEKCGFISKKSGVLQSYDAFFHLTGGTAFLKLFNEKKKNELLTFSKTLLNESCISRLVAKTEMKSSGMGDDYLFGIQAADGFSFGEDDYKGQHGYCLDREGYFPFYLAVGNNIESGGNLTGGCITDICPLAADMLGLKKWNTDGKNRLSQKNNSDNERN